MNTKQLQQASFGWSKGGTPSNIYKTFLTPTNI